jgi:hypothetical protein
MLALSKPATERPVMSKEEAIGRLQSLQYHGEEGSNVHASADTVLCDFLDAAGYQEVTAEFRKIHRIYPTAVPRYSRPS